MQKAHSEPKHLKTFRDKYLAVAKGVAAFLFLLNSFAGFSQAKVIIRGSQGPAVLAKAFDVKADGVTFDSAAYMNAFAYATANGIYEVIEPDGVSMVRNLRVPAYINFHGSGDKSELRFLPTGNNAQDATSYILIIAGSNGEVHDLKYSGKKAAGGYAVCNGMLVLPDAGGQTRRIYNTTGEGFAGYNASPVGGPYGINQNYAAADITNGFGTDQLIGGNGVVYGTFGGNPSWNANFYNNIVSTGDGTGVDCGFTTDSKFHDLWIYNFVGNAIVWKNNNQKIQASNIKFDRCRVLNPLEPFNQSLTKLIPHEPTIATDQGAMIVTGSGHVFSNIEGQENGSHAIQFGNATYSLTHSVFNGLNLDDNGGYDSAASGPTQLAYQRFGGFLYNYFDLVINGVAMGFRSNVTYGRQSRGLYVLGGTPTITNPVVLIRGNYYKIQAVGAGTDFTPWGAPSNTVGVVFKLIYPFGSTLPGTGSFGTGGQLTYPNDNLNINFAIGDQMDQIAGTGPGYDFSHDGGNSIINIVTHSADSTKDFPLIRSNGGILWHDYQNNKWRTKASLGIPANLADGNMLIGYNGASISALTGAIPAVDASNNFALSNNFQWFPASGRISIGNGNGGAPSYVIDQYWLAQNAQQRWKSGNGTVDLIEDAFTGFTNNRFFRVNGVGVAKEYVSSTDYKIGDATGATDILDIPIASRIVLVKHKGGIGTAPTTGSLGTNVTSVTPAGTEDNCTLTVVTSGAVSGGICTITFGTAWISNPNCVGIVPTNSATATGTSQMYCQGASTTTANFGGTIPSAGTYVFVVSFSK